MEAQSLKAYKNPDKRAPDCPVPSVIAGSAPSGDWGPRGAPAPTIL